MQAPSGVTRRGFRDSWRGRQKRLAAKRGLASGDYSTNSLKFALRNATVTLGSAVTMKTS